MSQPECKGGVCALPARAAPLDVPAAAPGEAPDYMKTLKISALIDSTGAAVAKPPNTPIVALYFSASWCPPCRAFSPMLSDFAAKHVTDITVIFVSMDNSEAEMMRFIDGKAFLAIPFSDRTLRQAVRAVRSHDVMDSPCARQLSSKFGVSAIPTLAILNSHGDLITDWGRSAITKNPDNCIAEWKQGSAGVSWLQLLRFW